MAQRTTRRFAPTRKARVGGIASLAKLKRLPK